MDLTAGRKHPSDNTQCFVGVVYATWCPHCTTLVGHNEAEYKNSDWYRVKKMLKNATDIGTTYLVNKTESEEKNKLAELSGKGIVANGFPTIYKYYIRPNETKATGVEYFRGGARDVNSILKWARNHANRFGKGLKFSGGSKRRVRKTTKRRRRGRATRRR
jgi:hypothetical protein